MADPIERNENEQTDAPEKWNDKDDRSRCHPEEETKISGIQNQRVWIIHTHYTNEDQKPIEERRD